MVIAVSPVSRFRLTRGPAATVPALELDAQQRHVVTHRGGPLLVLAGPGTGKTTTIVEAVADRVTRDGLDPERVLVLTFSRRAVADLRDRIAVRLARTVREPLARTFHSYAFGLLRREAVRAGEPPPRLLAGPEQDLMIRDLLAGDVQEYAAQGWPEPLRAALLTKGFAAELRDLLMRAAERGVGPEELAALGVKERRDDWPAVARFARQYHQVTALRQPPAYDPAELIRAAVDLLRRDAALLAAEQTDRRVVFVDEYQDCDPAQQELLSLIAGGGRDLVVMGDPDQSIYGFRGAEPHGIRDFPERFRDITGRPAPTVALHSSRRAGATLVTASRRVCARLGGPVTHRQLEAAGPVTGDVEVHVLCSANQEATLVAHRLREAHLIEGLPWDRMAVLARTAAALPVVRRACQLAGVPVTVRLEEIALVDQPSVWPLLRLVEVVTGRRQLDEPLAIELVTGLLGGADPLALRRLRQELRRHELSTGGGRASGQLLVNVLANPAELAALDPAAVRPAARIAQLLVAARTTLAIVGATVEDVLWAMWQTSGLAEQWSRTAVAGGAAGAEADRDLDAVLGLFDAAARFVDRLPQAGPEVFLDHLVGQEIPADTMAARAPQGETVSLLTAHAAKGLEWDVVAVVGVQEGVWPDLRLRGTVLGAERLVDLAAGRDSSAPEMLSRALAEERRLFYVAVTRPCRRLIVTTVQAEDAHPSRFLDELDPWRGEGERPATTVPRGLDLGSVVAELRATVCAPPDAIDPVTLRPYDDDTRMAAAHQLARLAAAGVRGADPDSWYGLGPLSDDAPLREPDEPVAVSPSKVDAFERCGLRWLLEAAGGTSRDSLSQSIGSLVHEIAAEAATLGLTAEETRALFERRWAAADVPTGWYGEKQRMRARAMVDRVIDLITTRADRLITCEHSFEVVVGRALLTGRVDRLERDDQGRLVVVDLKTGKTKPPHAELPNHPQLGAYQVAVEAGAFEAAAPGERRSGGAELVQLGNGTGPTVQRQPALSESPDPSWAPRLVQRTASGMAGASFAAVLNSYCGACQVRRSCPVHDEGRQVGQ
jgi:superfamily I DNA/RNA helicase/RecB family exonuclease